MSKSILIAIKELSIEGVQPGFASCEERGKQTRRRKKRKKVPAIAMYDQRTKRTGILLVLAVAGGLLAFSRAAAGYNFWDPGLNHPTVRTSYDSVSAGTPYQPLTIVSFDSGIRNPSFSEPHLCGDPGQPACDSSSYQYCPSGMTWAFNCFAGIQHNGSAWNAPQALDGVQTAFIQNLGTASQTINLPAGSYSLSFRAARREPDVVEPVRVTIDDQQIGALVEPPGRSFSAYSIPFSVETDGDHAIRFAGTDATTDKTTFIEAVCIPSTVNLYPCPTLSPQAPTIDTVSATQGAFPTGPASYGTGTSNAWWKNYSWGHDNFWVLSINNEAAFRSCNSGPPNLSLPRSSPGSGIYGFDVITAGGEYFNRAHLVLNLDATPNPCPIQTNIPFLSFGAQSTEGNGGPIGELNTGSGHTLSFVAKLWDYYTMRYQGGNGGAFFELFVTTEWPDTNGQTRQRMLFVSLWSDNLTSNRAHVHWNWPAKEEMWFNGADVAMFDADHMQSNCGWSIPTLQTVDTYYTIDLQNLFRCASDLGLFDNPMPTGYSLPITGVHWANEAAADYGALWTSVHGMNMQ